MKTICIAGKNSIAVDVLKYCIDNYNQYKLVCVLNRNECGYNSWQKSLKWFAEKWNIKIVGLEDVYELEDLIFLSVEFDRIVNPARFKSEDLYNIHFSLLPKYKGCYPSVLPILNDEGETGVTFHKIRRGIDTGEIIDQQAFSIDANDSSLDVYYKLINNGTEVVKRNIKKILNGDVSYIPQKKEKSFYYPSGYIDYKNLSLDVNCTAYQISNQIRAFNFRPYQVLTWNSEKYIDCEILETVSEMKPGTVIEDNSIYTIISTIDYDAKIYKDLFEKACELAKKGEDFSELCESREMIKARNEKGWSLLTIAVYNNNIKMVKWLINKGADINIVNNNGTTLLMYAKDCYVNTGDSTVFEYLLDIGVNVDVCDYTGKKLIDYCCEQGIDSIGTYKMK